MSRKKDCPFCANEVLEKAIRCQFCQSDIEPGICVACKKRNRVEAAFCGHCGSERVIHAPGWRPVLIPDSSAPAPDPAAAPARPASSPREAKGRWALVAAGGGAYDFTIWI